MPLNTKQKKAGLLAIRNFVAIAAVGSCHLAYSQNRDCLEQAGTPLVKTYCQIVAKDPGAKLPNIGDFKKNPPQIQRLLLSQYSERLHIPLPGEPEQKDSQSTYSTSRTRMPQVSATATSLPVNAVTRRAPTEHRIALTNCELDKDKIRCQTELYELQVNKKINQLLGDVFSAENELRMPSKDKTKFADDSDYNYLSYIYPMYVYKMLDLGLGDSTMSFTKFAAVYWQSKRDGSNFTERFRQTYNTLKIERSSNAMKARYRDNYPNNLGQCMRMDEKIILCDDMHQNWIYKLK